MSELTGFDLLAQKRQTAATANSELVQAQHAMSKLTARERIAKLLDSESFVEMHAFAQHSNAAEGLKEVSAPGEGVVTGYGTIDGRGVYVFSQDYTVLGGAMGAMHARKILKLLDMAGKTGLPVIALLDSMGARLGEGASALEGFGSVFAKMVELSGVVPILTVICGQCAGSAAFFVPLSDFVFMSEGVGGIYTAAPGAFNETGKTVKPEAIGGASVHFEKTGLVHFKCKSEDDALRSLRCLLSFLPDNNLVDTPDVDGGDDLNRMIENYSGSWDITSVISSVFDNGVFIESQAGFATAIKTGFARLGGRSVGVVANAPGSSIDTKSSQKAAGFVSFCDAFGLPVITLADTAGFVKDLAQEQCCLISNGAKLIQAYAGATVPKLTVITGKAIGSGYIAMAPKALGADMVYAWPDAEISCLPADAAAVIFMSDDIAQSDEPIEARKEAAEKYAKTFGSPWEAAKMGCIDEVIYPSETRQRLAGALELAIGKRESRLPKKHASRL
jgi:acetyl-CoA carboxylase carboxyltransferase component